MILTLDEELSELRELVTSMIDGSGGMRNVRSVLASSESYDRELWKQFVDSGLVGIAIPEEYGGSDGGTVARGVVLEELGRAVLPTPYLATAVLATDVLLAADAQPMKADLLQQIASGERIGAVAIAEPGKAWPLQGTQVQAVPQGEVWILNGVKTTVISGGDADFFLIYAETSQGPGWFVAEAEQPGLERVQLQGIDETRGMSQLTLRDAICLPLIVSDAVAVAAQVRDRAIVALAAEAIGGHEHVLSMTVEYAKIRYQFGRQIGSYQAVKHGLVNVYSQLELAQSVVRYASWAATDQAEEQQAAALAGQFVPRAYQEAALAAIHFHGGIGFTLEHDAHFFYKRAQSIALLLGGGSERAERLAVSLGL